MAKQSARAKKAAKIGFTRVDLGIAAVRLTADDVQPQDVQRYIGIVAALLAAEVLEPNEAREHKGLATAANTTIRTREGMGEMDELRKLVAEAQSAADKRKRNEVEARYSGSGGQAFGRVPLPDDGKH
jgi:hypothetical protein